jgi:ribonucleoside-diphosphate reductase alpha chain
MGVKIDRPTITKSETCEMEATCVKLFVTLGHVDGAGEPIEVFITAGHAGECIKAFSEALGRMTSLAMQYGAPLPEVIQQLKGIQCPKPVTFPKAKRVLSCPDAVAKALEALSQKGKNESNVSDEQMHLREDAE